MTTRHPSFRCPCCGDRSIFEPGAYDICGCGWEDDPMQADNPDLAGGANEQSLNEARRTWRQRAPWLNRDRVRLPS